MNSFYLESIQNHVSSFTIVLIHVQATASYSLATAKSLQSCPTLCDPIDDSPPGSPVPGILQTRILEWVAISFSNAWKWKVKVKLLSRAQLQRPHGLQPARLLHPWDFPGKSTGVGCHCFLPGTHLVFGKSWNPNVVIQWWLTLCDTMDCSQPGFSVSGIHWVRKMKWVAIPFSGAYSQPRDGTRVSCSAGRFITTWGTRSSIWGSLASEYFH